MVERLIRVNALDGDFVSGVRGSQMDTQGVMADLISRRSKLAEEATRRGGFVTLQIARSGAASKRRWPWQQAQTGRE
jgi:hypothetical protein